MMSSIRISDAQFSATESWHIRREALTGALRLTCPRCGRALSAVTAEHTPGVDRAGPLLRCAHCRRFVVIEPDGAAWRAEP